MLKNFPNRLTSFWMIVLLAICQLPAFGQRATLVDQSNLAALVNSPEMPAFATNPSKLDLVVRVPPGTEVPVDLKDFVIPEVNFAASRLKIDASNQAAVTAALSNTKLHAEFIRPKSLLPTFELAPNNLDARISHRVPEFEAAFAMIRGKGIVVAIFDEGRIRETHQEFQLNDASRVTIKTTASYSRHSTHCAGTVGAKGFQMQAIGMATQAGIFSYDWNNDSTKLNQDAPSTTALRPHRIKAKS